MSAATHYFDIHDGDPLGQKCRRMVLEDGDGVECGLPRWHPVHHIFARDTRAGLQRCSDCGHIHTADGCSGPLTPSDVWAGVSPSACDCGMKPCYFVDVDGGGDDTLWLEREGKDPLAILRECDLPSTARHLWPTFVAATGALLNAEPPDGGDVA